MEYNISEKTRQALALSMAKGLQQMEQYPDDFTDQELKAILKFASSGKASQSLVQKLTSPVRMINRKNLWELIDHDIVRY